MQLKGKFEEYTETEFTQLITEIFSAEGGEVYQDALLENFITVAEHPDGSDLIYYNDNDDITPQQLVDVIKRWRRDNGKPGFKQEL